MAENKKQFVTVNLVLTREQHSRLKDLKDGRTWEAFVLDIAGVE